MREEAPDQRNRARTTRKAVPGMADFEAEELLDEDQEPLVLTDEETGEDVVFEQLDVIEYEGQTYAFLLPVDADEDESVEVLIMRVTPVEGAEVDEDGEPAEEEYSYVEDGELLDKLLDLFCDLHGDDADDSE